jgi:hypothetical protein
MRQENHVPYFIRRIVSHFPSDLSWFNFTEFRMAAQGKSVFTPGGTGSGRARPGGVHAAVYLRKKAARGYPFGGSLLKDTVAFMPLKDL